jgi:hypothetical protein
VAGLKPAKTASGFPASLLRCRHELSTLIAGVGGGRYLGELPRSKVSMMMIMRPPQHGQG